MKIVEILSEVLGDSINVPCHNTVENWMKKLGLSVYQDDKPCKGEKYAMVMDESIAINGQKLLLALAIPSDHQGRPTRHEVVTILEMSVASKFNGEDIKEKVQSAADNAGANPQFVISDNGHNLVRGITDSGFIRHADISHSLGVVLKNVYGKDADFCEPYIHFRNQETAISPYGQSLPTTSQHEGNSKVYEYVVLGDMGQSDA